MELPPGTVCSAERSGKSPELVLPAMKMFPAASTAMAFAWSVPLPLKVRVNSRFPEASSLVTKMSLVDWSG